MSEVNLIWETDIWEDGIWSYEGNPIEEGNFPTTGSSHPQRSRRQRLRVYALTHKVPVELEKPDKPIPLSQLPLQDLLSKSNELLRLMKEKK